MSSPSVAVVVPFFQRRPGILRIALESAFAQTVSDLLHVIVVDDGSPVKGASELAELPEALRSRVQLIERPNGGAGAARNTALDSVPPGTRFVAFLDSDDRWRPDHVENALRALDRGYDAFFEDFYAVNYPDQTNFQRIGTLRIDEHRPIDPEHALYEMSISPIEHIVSDGGGVIQTSTVVYSFERFPKLRFREEFYNGQDFFFWMDLGMLQAKWAFSTQVGCENGEGINIYQAAGWGSDRSLNRLRNELFVWTSVNRIYPLDETLRAANRRTIRHLQDTVVRDLLHRIKNRRPTDVSLLRDIVRLDPAILAVAPVVPFRIISERLFAHR